MGGERGGGGGERGREERESSERRCVASLERWRVRRGGDAVRSEAVAATRANASASRSKSRASEKRSYYHLAVWGHALIRQANEAIAGKRMGALGRAQTRGGVYATPTQQRPPWLEDDGCCLGLCAHGVVEHALWGTEKGMTIRKMEYGSAC